MITQVTVQNFKRYKDATEFNLKPDGVTFLAGGNNSGKSSLLQAMAVWEFCRSIIEQEKGLNALCAGYAGAGIGINAEEFSPVALPDLKHLWSNLRVGGAGYGLKLKCQWNETREGQPPQSNHLEFSLSLANDRLFIKPSSSTLSDGCHIPRMAYLPPFAGITPKEEKMSPAARKRLIGRGVAGAILRNILYDLWSKNAEGLAELKDSRGKISRKEKSDFIKRDSWERLAETLIEVFKVGLTVEKFNDLYHTTIKVALFEGDLVNAKFRKRNGFSPRDIMVEGSGFLQWLSVYALAVNPDIDILLLDEPDAHLHPTLQGHLTFKLNQLAVQNEKQVLVATHSTTILTDRPCDAIYRMDDGVRGYLKSEKDKISLFAGLGSQYAPHLEQLKRHKRLFLYEGPTDFELLKIWTQTLGYQWPSTLYAWPYKDNQTKREALFNELQKLIPGLRGISLKDRDDIPIGEVKEKLTLGSQAEYNTSGIGYRLWKRRNINNYLLVPAAIARATNKTIEEIKEFLQTDHSISVPLEHAKHDCHSTLMLVNGKDITEELDNGICKQYGVTCADIARAMDVADIADDVKVLIQQIQDLCR